MRTKFKVDTVHLYTVRVGNAAHAKGVYIIILAYYCRIRPVLWARDVVITDLNSRNGRDAQALTFWCRPVGRVESKQSGCLLLCYRWTSTLAVRYPNVSRHGRRDLRRGASKALRDRPSLALTPTRRFVRFLIGLTALKRRSAK
jgi:hypothetical protein